MESEVFYQSYLKNWRRAACTQAAVKRCKEVKLIRPGNSKTYAVAPVARIVPVARRGPYVPRVTAPGAAANDTVRG